MTSNRRILVLSSSTGYLEKTFINLLAVNGDIVYRKQPRPSARMQSLTNPASITKRKQACNSCRHRKKRCDVSKPPNPSLSTLNGFRVDGHHVPFVANGAFLANTPFRAQPTRRLKGRSYSFLVFYIQRNQLFQLISKIKIGMIRLELWTFCITLG